MQPPSQSKMRLVVQHRDFTYEELQAQTTREDMLKHDSEDEEEEGEEEEGSDHEDRRSPQSAASSSEGISVIYLVCVDILWFRIS